MIIWLLVFIIFLLIGLSSQLSELKNSNEEEEDFDEWESEKRPKVAFATKCKSLWSDFRKDLKEMK